MRGQDSSRRLITRRLWGIVALALVMLTGSVAVAQMLEKRVPQLSGEADPMSNVDPGFFPKWVVDDQRRMRAYPEQPPTIPHAIDGYQLTVNTNRCLSCHRREFTESSGAPMISVTHFQTRSGQMLADVSPRRYFCTQCHVQQADAKPLVENTFKDMSELGFKPQGSEQ